MTQVFYGYPGRVWAVVFAALGDLTTALELAADPFSTIPLAQAVLATAQNGLDAINANRIAQVLGSAANTMQQIEALPITLDPTTIMYFQNRLDAVTAASSGISALVPPISLTGINTSLVAGNPAIPDIGFLEYLIGFNVEPAPPGMDNTNLSTYVTQSSVAFATLATAIASLVNGSKTFLFDLATEFSRENATFAEFLAGFLQFSNVPGSQNLWNQMFVMPSLLMYADLISAAPSTVAAQQDMLIRYLIITVIQQLQLFIMTVSRPVAQEAPQSVVRVDDSLMDIAARGLGNYEQWAAVAALNNLQPPYIGPKSNPGTGVVGWGQFVELPSLSTQPGVIPNYLRNFLGVDIYFGPLNGDMPAWTGDFQLIAGYENLKWALGRRLQTTLGTLIYHNDFGSRIPPEVGEVQIPETAGYIAAFGKSAILSDPRVDSVPSATATLGPNFSIAFNAETIPKGPGNTPVQISEVISNAVTPGTLRQSANG